MGLAPIVVFAYRRPDHTARLLASLHRNPEAAASMLYVYCDGPRTSADTESVQRTRDVVRAAGFTNVAIVERPENIGLAANIIEGVTRVCRNHGRAIVLEDDLVLSSTFLRYMNAALDRYADQPRVLHVSGFMYPVELATEDDAVFLPFISSWGWGTWSRAWQCFDPTASGHSRVLSDRAMRHRFDLDGNYTFASMLRRHLAGYNDSWAIRWYLSVFLRDGLALFPKTSLVENHGFGGNATNCLGPVPKHITSRASEFVVARFPDVALNDAAFRRVRSVMAADSTIIARALRKVRRYMSVSRFTPRILRGG